MSLQLMLPSIKLLIIKHNEENRLKVDACAFGILIKITSTTAALHSILRVCYIRPAPSKEGTPI